MLSRLSLGLVAVGLLLWARSAHAEDCGASPPEMRPPATQVLWGDEPHYRPLLNFELAPKCMRLEIPVSAAASGEVATRIPLDSAGNVLPKSRSFRPRFRLGARFDSGQAWLPIVLHGEYEHDLPTGTLQPDVPFEGRGYAGAGGIDHELRQAFVRISLGRYAHLGVGWMTSHWGLGLVANDGAHGWQPGSGRFSDPRSGDRVLRAQLATGPHTDAGLFAAVNADLLDGDWLTDDDVLLPGDRAMQVSMAAIAGRGRPNGAGIYGVARHQETPNGAATDVFAGDLYLHAGAELGKVKLALEAEAVVVAGTTELAPSTDFPEHDVLQLGAALRGTLDAGRVASVFDVMYASGDQNLDDGVQNAFKADPNYEMGLLLFRHVLANQSARAVFTAGDPELVGIPANDLDRIPTRGSATNTLALFPRLRIRPIAGLEFYFGPLFALAAKPPADPLNTRVAGGSARNALGGAPGRYLGTEVDAGVRYRVNIAGSEITAGIEGGSFRPGSALQHADGTLMDPVHGARMMLDAKL